MAKQASIMQKLIRFMFRVLTILTIELWVTLLNVQLIKLDERWDKPTVTLVGMASAVVLFYFLMEYIDRWTTVLLKATVGVGNVVKFRKTAIITIMAALFYGQYLCYYRLWFGRWPAVPGYL